MNWPLKNQILLRMSLLLLVTIVALTLTNIRSIIAANRSVEHLRLQRIMDLVSNEKFPLTSPVLENMKLLSSADFILVAEDQNVVSKTSEAPQFEARWNRPNHANPEEITINAKSFSHASVKGVEDPRNATNDSQLHIFMPRKSSRQVWWDASKFPITMALIILPLAFLVSVAMASQVTRPLSDLKSQVQQIAKGNLDSDRQIHGNLEIQSLQDSVNEMAVKLAIHDTQQRKTERLKTLVQLGSSVAHHLRNAATGCKMAVELMASENREVAGTENYQVALRQLTLMDSYIKKFMVLSKSSEENEFTNQTQFIDFAKALESVQFLLGPSAKHLGVELNVESEIIDPMVQMQTEDAQQLMINLISNGISAASAMAAQNATDANLRSLAVVNVFLSVGESMLEFSVADNGSGPPTNIESSMFEPFVTGSPEGTGLGLSVVNEIAQRVGGSVNWFRKNDMTVFKFEAPLHRTELQETNEQ